jgi:hypothetical protein
MLNHSLNAQPQQNSITVRSRGAKRLVATSLIAAQRAAGRRIDQTGRTSASGEGPSIDIAEVIARYIDEQPPQLYRGEP